MEKHMCRRNVWWTKHFTGTLNKWSKINNLKYEDSSVLGRKRGSEASKRGKKQIPLVFLILKKGGMVISRNKAPLQIKTMDSGAPV